MTKSNAAIIDTHAWIEYFNGSQKGQTVAPYIEGGHGITPLIVIAELSAYYARENLTSWEEDFRFIEAKTAITALTLEVAKAAGSTRQQMRRERQNFGLIDAIIYELARSLGATLISGDPHFKGLPNVQFLED